MKLVFFSNSYLPYLSGITLSMESFRQELEKLGHTVFVVGPKYPCHQDTNRRILRLPSFPATYPGYRFVFPFSPAVFNAICQEKVDLIHAHQPFGVGLAALFLARKLKVPFVYSFHTLFTRYVHHAPFVPQRLAKFLVSKYLTFFCNQADTVIVPSEMVRRLLVLRKVKVPIKVIPTGLNLAEAKQQAAAGDRRLVIEKDYGLKNGAKILLYTGRIAEEKNLPFLLAAFKAIRQKEANTYLLLVGGGPKEKEYQRLAQKLDPNIIFVGPKPPAEVMAFYAAADLFVYASTTETQGLVLTEAKACGLPIVAVFGGGIADVIENGVDGYLVPQNQELFVAHVLRLIKDDALRQKMAGLARQDAHSRFSATIVAKKMESVYNALVSKRRV